MSSRIDEFGLKMQLITDFSEKLSRFVVSENTSRSDNHSAANFHAAFRTLTVSVQVQIMDPGRRSDH